MRGFRQPGGRRGFRDNVGGAGGGSSGVASLTAGSNISLSASTGNPTITGTGNLGAATAAGLAALDCTNLQQGTTCVVASSVSTWDLLPSAAAAVPFVNIAALNKAGFQWVRRMVRNPTLEVLTAWTVDPQNVAASDDAAAPGPLKTLAELSRRLAYAVFPTGVTVSVTLASDCLNTDKVLWTFDVQPGAAAGTGLVITGTPTVIYTGTVTGFVQQAQGGTASATDNELTDSTIPVSYTASGLVAKGLIYARTNSTACWWYPLKDLGAKTLRMSDAVDVTATAVRTLAVNDTYTVSQLPKIYDQAFTSTGRVSYVTYILVDDNSTTSPTPSSTSKVEANLVYDRSTFSTNHNLANTRLKNCANEATSVCLGAGYIRMDCGVGSGVGGGSMTVGDGCVFINAIGVAIHFQGNTLFLNGGPHGVGVLAFYDTPTDGLVLISGSTSMNGIKGVGNSGKLIRASDTFACIGYNSTTAPPCVGASSSDPLPIKCGDTTIPGTSIAPASLPLVAEITTRMLAVVPF